MGSLNAWLQACPVELVPLLQNLGIGIGDRQEQVGYRVLGVGLHQQVRLEKGTQGWVVEAGPIFGHLHC